MSVLQQIVQFNKDRALNTFNQQTEYLMLQEELQEYLVGCVDDDYYQITDALCDIIVVATGALYKLGYDPEKALQETLKEITSRQGKINFTTGKWEKDSNQDPNTLYTADYDKTKE